MFLEQAEGKSVAELKLSSPSLLQLAAPSNNDSKSKWNFSLRWKSMQLFSIGNKINHLQIFQEFSLDPTWLSNPKKVKVFKKKSKQTDSNLTDPLF